MLLAQVIYGRLLTFLCKGKLARFSVERLLAVWLYMSGLSMCRISRLFQCLPQSVLNWVRP